MTTRMRNTLGKVSLEKMAARRKDGSPDAKYYDSIETISLFEQVKQWLNKNGKKVWDYVGLSLWSEVPTLQRACLSCLQYIQADSPSARTLSSLVQSILQFQEVGYAWESSFYGGLACSGCCFYM